MYIDCDLMAIGSLHFTRIMNKVSIGTESKRNEGEGTFKENIHIFTEKNDLGLN